jgi:MoxR-like ATPase
LHLYIDYPAAQLELEIVRQKAPGLAEALAQQLVETVQAIRTLDLRKAPSIGETLDWAQALVVLNAPQLTKELIEATISVLIKYERDTTTVLAHLNGASEGQQFQPATHHHHYTHEQPSQTVYDHLRRPQSN